jgi:solute carrier family 35 protein E3
MQARSASLPEPDGGGASARGGQAQLLSLGFNYLSAVSLVVLNKMVFVGMAFSWPAAMTLFHYAVTLVLLWTLRLAGVFESVKVPMSSRMYLLAVIVGLTPVVNLMALRFSSVGMFQTSKLCLVPLVVLGERLTQGKAVSLARGTALSVVVAATAASIVDDLELTALGLFWCLVWIPFAALYNIMTAQEMAASGVGPLQLLYVVVLCADVRTALLSCRCVRLVLRMLQCVHYHAYWCLPSTI